jgi:glycogen operon protein
MNNPEPSHYGKSSPIGATLYPGGVNFSVFSRQCTSLDLLLFDSVDDARPSRIIELSPGTRHHSYHYWHVFVPGLEAGQIYAYRAHGPFAPADGLRFDSEKVLLDPYGRCLAQPAGYNRGAACKPGNNTSVALKSVVVDPDAYDWENDLPLHTPYVKSVLYEMHVAGFTRHPSSGVPAERRGTYAGLIDKIPYLRDLGITAVELMPVFAFDDQDGPPGMVNYWGYSPISFFAPHVGYSSRRDPLGVLDEFRDMVKALHRAGIEVILDVVYNHTAEGNENGPNLCFRGLANEIYYVLEQNKSWYSNYTGCGNTLNANQPICRRLILDSLRYWVTEMHVDGFRFDLASILARNEQGQPMTSPPILWDIESDPALSGTKLIAEAWDAAGLYQVGSFVGDSWNEWNGRFRDDIRAFVKGDGGMTEALKNRFTGSPDVYGREDREPEQSINFITCHDGFTLNDLVSYNGKHNEANGEGNRDGSDSNGSWNCGVEGPTSDPEVERLRNRQVKNFLALTLLSIGTPMLLMGDEVRRTQSGNNNAYCQNNEISWFDWTLVDKHADLLRFVKQIIALRLNRNLSINRHDISLRELLRQQPVNWHGVKLNSPDWGHALSANARILGGAFELLILFNAYWEPLSFEIPPINAPYEPWRRCIDTCLDSPNDICDSSVVAPVISDAQYLVQPRSTVLLISGRSKQPDSEAIAGNR